MGCSGEIFAVVAGTASGDNGREAKASGPAGFGLGGASR